MHLGTTIHSVKLKLRHARHTLYEYLPFVKRKRYRRCIIERDIARASIVEQQVALQGELEPIYTILLSMPKSLANTARIEWIKPLPTMLEASELCLFVTHSQTHDLKLHAVDHIRQLAAEGIAVVLVINTNVTHTRIQIPDDLFSILHACVARENVGYDFGAWSHAYSLVDASKIRRLFLVNDSIIGTLDDRSFSSMITRIRQCDADLIGLTQNYYPKWHLQSFFLVINRKLLETQVFSDLIGNIVNLPTKEAVINVYEVQISSFLLEQGFSCNAVFPHLDPGSTVPDDTHARWSQLIESGFPFIKASVFREFRNHPKAIKLIPEKYHQAVISQHGTKPEELENSSHMFLFKKRPSDYRYLPGLQQWCPELSPELAAPTQWLRTVNHNFSAGIAKDFDVTPGAHKWHHYFRIYDDLFGPLRQRPIRMLEIGVYKGASLSVWRKYFHPETLIVGVDIDPSCAQFNDVANNVNIVIGPQQDKDFIIGVIRQFGPFDLIIDDGSHVPSHMIGSFNHLFDRGLNPGGLYFVEDTHTNYWKSHRDSNRSFMDFCFGLVECMHAHYVEHTGEYLFRVRGPDALEYASVPRITTLIEEIRFLDSVVAIRKALNKSLPQSQHW